MSTKVNKVGVILVTLLSGLLLAALTQSAAAHTSENVSCIFEEFTTKSGFTQHKWPAAPVGGACIAVTINPTVSVNTLEITGGWVFTSPVTVNGIPISSAMVIGELAPQISRQTLPVENGDVLIFEPTWNPDGTELGFWWNLLESAPTPPPPPSDYRVFLPAVMKPQTALEKTVKISSRVTSQPIVEGWGNAAVGQQTCLNVEFIGSGNAVLESGWFFGTNFSALLNENPINIPVSPPPAEQTASQIGTAYLVSTQTLKVCVVREENSLPEIGLRIRYPAP